jgi:hypothetical protein
MHSAVKSLNEGLCISEAKLTHGCFPDMGDDQVADKALVLHQLHMRAVKCRAGFPDYLYVIIMVVRDALAILMWIGETAVF